MKSDFQSKKQPTGNYEVGYKKPPTGGQWKKGQSGNPKGRRRLSGNIFECHNEILAETGVVQLNSKKTRVTRAKTVMLRLHQLAMDGNLGAIREIVRLEQARAAKRQTEGWTRIVVKPVFEEEENRLMQLADENRELTERNRRLEERLEELESQLPGSSVA